MIRFVALVFLVLIPASVAGQDVVYEGGFERAVNRYRWNGFVELTERTDSWSIAVSNRFRSDAFLLFDDRLSFRDLNSLRLEGTRPLGPSTRFVATGRSDWFSLSRVLSQSLYTGVSWGSPRFAVTPLLGAAMDRRPGVRTAEGTPMRADAGPAVGARLEIHRQDVSGYSVEVSGEGSREYIAPRRGSMARIRGSAERAFERTRLRLDVEGASARRDAYQAASFLNRDDATERLSETVESTRSDTIGATLGMLAPVGQAVQVSGSLTFNANNRRVRTLRAPEEALFFDSDFSRRTVDAESGVTYSRGLTQLRLGIQGGAEIERRSLANEGDLPSTQAAQKRDLLRQADYDRGYVTLQGMVRVPLNPRATLVLDGSANAIRHDTPIINPDDRDEVFYSGRVAVLYRASRAFETDLQLYATRYHTVYLKAARSAENNVQEGLRLRPSLRWRPRPGTRIQLGSEIRATYTVDDFTLPGRRATDQSARELRYDLEFEHDLRDGLRVYGEGSTSDLRLGRFLDDVFAEIPIDTLKTYGGWIRVQSGTRIAAEIGLRLFIRTDFDRSATVRYPRIGEDGAPLVDAEGNELTTTISRSGRQRIAQIGPTCALLWPMRAGLLRFEGWYTVQRVSHTLYGDLPEVSADVIRREARTGQRTVIPNLSLSMRWNI